MTEFPGGAPTDDQWIEDASLPTLKRVHYLEKVFGKEPPEGYPEWIRSLTLSAVELEFFKKKLYGQLIDRLSITGVVPTKADLPENGSDSGDVWYVESDSHIYLWVEGDYFDLGTLKGDPGPNTIPTDQAIAAAIVNGEATSGALNSTLSSRINPIENIVEAAKAESSNAVSRVSALETLGGLSPGNVSDSTISLHIDQAQSDARASVKKVVFKVPSNLIDLTKITSGQVYPQGSGVTESNAAFSVTDWIPVREGKDYYFTGTPLRITYFDDNKSYIGFFSFPSSPYVRNTPAGAVWARVSVSNVNLPEVQMNLGSVAQPYDLGGIPKIRQDNLPLITGQLIEKASIDPSKTTFFTPSTNLFNPNGVLEGHVIPAGSGTPVANSAYKVSGKTSIESGTKYTYFPLSRVTYFDDKDNYVLHHNGTLTKPDTFTVPARAVYAKISLRNDDYTSFQMNRGDKLLSYEPGGKTLIDPSFLPKLSGDKDTEKGFFVDTKGLDQIYSGPEVTAPVGLYNTMPADVYGWYDELLAAHPEYITKTDLGKAQDNIYNLYSYTFKVPEVPTEVTGTAGTAYRTPTPVLLLISGVHGYEKPPVYHLYRFAKALCEEWASSPVLEALRWGFEIVIIPLGNPYSYAEKIRYNSRNVDIARNFPADWKTSTYSGANPLSESESLILNGLMTSLADRTVGGVSFHSFGASEQYPQNVIWQAAPSRLSLDIGKQLVKRMSRKWKAEKLWITNPSTYYGYSDLRSPEGSEGRQMTSYGYPGSTFEVSSNQRLDGGSGTEYSQRAMTLGYETIVNYIAMLALAGLKYKGNSEL